MAAAAVCPVVGTSNTVLPPSHPEFDLSQPGLTCPVTNATTDHHSALHLVKHPSTQIPSGANPNDAASCPALKKIISEPEQKKLDEAVCPVVGPVSSVLPPDHPSVEGKESEVCPVTKASLGSHKGKVGKHPVVDVKSVEERKGCPVVGGTVA